MNRTTFSCVATASGWLQRSLVVWSACGSHFLGTISYNLLVKTVLFNYFIVRFSLVGSVNLGFLCVGIQIPQGLLNDYPHSQASAGAYGDDPVT